MMATKKGSEEKRENMRLPYRCPVSYVETGGASRRPNGLAARGEILDLSNGGMGMLTEGRAPEEGVVIQSWIPMSYPRINLPVLMQVKWVREERPGAYQVGTRFML